MWVRGLKPFLNNAVDRIAKVAPHVGAWIETLGSGLVSTCKGSRTPCGCVD